MGVSSCSQSARAGAGVVWHRQAMPRSDGNFLVSNSSKLEHCRHSSSCHGICNSSVALVLFSSFRLCRLECLVDVAVLRRNHAVMHMHVSMAKGQTQSVSVQPRDLGYKRVAE